MPIDDGPEGTADVGAPIGTDETSSETKRPSMVLDTSDLELPEPEGSDDESPTILVEGAPPPEEVQGQDMPTLLQEPEQGDVFVMEEEDEEASTEVMSAAEARARAVALAAEEDAAAVAEEPVGEVPVEAPEPPEETSPPTDEGAPEPVPADEEATLVFDASELEAIDEEITQPVPAHPEITEEEEDQGSVDEVILTKEQAAKEVEKVKATEPPTPRAASRPTPKVKPKVKAKKSAGKAKKDVAAKFYAASASIPTIRDESTPKPRAAAVKLGGDGQSAQVLGDEMEDEPIAIGGVEY